MQPVGSTQMIDAWDEVEKLASSGNYDAVLVDFFDTLVIRQTLTEQIFFQREWGVHFFWKYHIYRITRYVVLKLTRRELNPSFLGKRIVKKLKPIFERDLDGVAVREKAKATMVHLLNSGVEVFVVSNSILNSDIIARKLNSENVPFLRVFTSGEVGYLKSQGLLHSVISSEKLNPLRVLVVGDDLKEDILPARRAGCTTVEIPAAWFQLSPVASREQLRMIASAGGGYDFISTVVREYLLPETLNLWEVAGFLYSFPLASFIAYRLKREMEKAKIESIIFLSREGYFPFRIFEEKESFEKIQSFYVYVSRALLDSPDGRSFIRTQLAHLTILGNRTAIFDVGWRGRVLQSVRELLEKPSKGFLFGIWPWAGVPLDVIQIAGSRLNLNTTIQIRRCPEIFEFLLSAPHETMRSVDVIEQVPQSKEYLLCKGFELALTTSDLDMNRKSLFKYFDSLIKRPNVEQAQFFGSFKHSVGTEPSAPLIDRSRVLWINGAKKLGVVSRREIVTEYCRRFISVVK